MDLSVVVTETGKQPNVLAGNFHDTWDTVNNVEQVWIQDLNSNTATDIVVHVRGTWIPHGKQSFSLVVTGNFEEFTACNNQCIFFFFYHFSSLLTI